MKKGKYNVISSADSSHDQSPNDPAVDDLELPAELPIASSENINSSHSKSNTPSIYSTLEKEDSLGSQLYNRGIYFVFLVLLFAVYFWIYISQQVSPPNTLGELCNQTTWQEGLYLNCTNIKPAAGFPADTVNPQGLSNLINVLKVCVRMAIDAGMGFVMPRIAVRSENNPAYFYTFDELSFLFDEAHFKQTLNKECPQLKIYDNTYEVPNSIFTAFKKFQPWNSGEYRDFIDNLVKDVDISNSPTSIWENDQLFLWDFCKENKNITRSIVRSIKFDTYLLSVANRLVSLIESDYLGFHLRAESDWPWYKYENVMPWFKKIYASKYKHLKLIYVAVGSTEIEERFRKEMEAEGAKVLSKWSVGARASNLLAEMHKLKFDQLAALDWEVLLKSTSFTGIGTSSYSYGIAIQRGDGNLANCNCDLYEKLFDLFPCNY